jgi:hypothetical protein
VIEAVPNAHASHERVPVDFKRAGAEAYREQHGTEVTVGPICGNVRTRSRPRRISMWDRIESLFLIFCGLVVLFIVMRPGTETFLARIFPWWFRTFLTSLFEALFLSLILFGILGVIAARGVNAILHRPISFIVVSGIGTALFLWGNTTKHEDGSTI